MNADLSQAVSELKRSIDLLLKLKILEIRGERTNKELICELDSMGFRPKEIADLLGVTPNSVSPVLSRSRRN